MSRWRRAILVAAPMVSACQGLYQASLPQYNRCPPGLTEAWTSAKDVTKHTCFDKDHRPQGEVRAWRPDAGGYALVLTGSYRDGVPIGEWEEWTGLEKRTSTWNDRGQRVKVRQFDAEGRLQAESAGDVSTRPLFDDTLDEPGARNGPWREYLYTGADDPEKWEVVYSNGRKAGHARHLDANGDLLEEGEFVAGKREGTWKVVSPETHQPTTARYAGGELVTPASPVGAPSPPSPERLPAAEGSKLTPPAEGDALKDNAGATPSAVVPVAGAPPGDVADAWKTPETPAPWQADITVGGRASGTAPVGGYASVVDAKLFIGWAAWPKAHGVPFYLAFGPMVTVGQSLLDACGRSGQPSCPDDFTWSFGPEGRVGIASMYTSEETGRPSPSVILFLGVAPTLRGARTVDTYEQKSLFALRMTAGLAVPRSWGTWSNLSKSDMPYFFPNEVEVVFETTAPAYLAHPDAWGAAAGYSF